MTLTLPESIRRRSGQRGFTVPEYAVSVALVMIVGATMLTAFLFGGRMFLVADVKLDATEDMRFLNMEFVHDIRTCSDFGIGNYVGTNFTLTATNVARQGNAIKIYPTASTNFYIRYWVDTNAQALKVFVSGETNSYIIIDSVTNKIAFTAEDIAGNPVTNEQPQEIVGLLVQIDEAVVKASTNKSSASFNQYYQFRTRANKRNNLGFQQ